MKRIHLVAMIVVIIGAVNWGLVGIFQFDLVAAMLGPAGALSRLVYSVVGWAGLVLAYEMVTACAAGHRPVADVSAH
jgi:uncharacterized membrane protein YuzA (DUF378 family)